MFHPPFLFWHPRGAGKDLRAADGLHYSPMGARMSSGALRRHCIFQKIDARQGETRRFGQKSITGERCGRIFLPGPEQPGIPLVKRGDI